MRRWGLFMSKKPKTFHDIVEKNFEQLDLYTTAITRAHGENHPEAFEVRELFETINQKVQEAGGDKPDLNTEFTKLRIITENYKAPKGVCGTYVGTYNMLSEIDEIYYGKQVKGEINYAKSSY